MNRSLVPAVLGIVLWLATVAPAADATRAADVKRARCHGATVQVVLRGASRCITVTALKRSAPARGPLGSALLDLTASSSLWAQGAHKTVHGALGAAAPAFLSYDHALRDASEKKGDSLLPSTPKNHFTPNADGDTTLGLDVTNTPVGWAQELANRVQRFRENGGVQDKKAVTDGRLAPATGPTASYEVSQSQEFLGDPCPAAGGSVRATIEYSVKRRTEGLLGESLEEVATVGVDVDAQVGANGRLLHYQVVATVLLIRGGERIGTGSVSTPDTLKIGGVVTPADVGKMTLGNLGKDKISSAEATAMAGFAYRALLLGKNEADAWLKRSEGIWYTKAECKKVKAKNTGALKPGEKRVVPVTIKGNGGQTAASETVTLKGKGGLQVKPAKVTAKGGKFKVTVTAPKSGKYPLGRASALALEVEGVSTLGRGVGRFPFGLEHPRSYSGPISGTASYGSLLGPGNAVEAHWSGNVKLTAASPLDPSFPWVYVLDAAAAGSINYTVGGRLGDCDMAGNTTIDFTGFALAGTVGLMIFAGEPPTYGFVLPIPTNFFIPMTLSNCADPNRNGSGVWMPGTAVPCIVDAGPGAAVPEDGTLAGTRSGTCADRGLLDQTWQWNLAPAPPA